MMYLDLYNQYRKELNEIKAKLSMCYSIKYDESMKKETDLLENKKIANKFLVISFALIMILFGVVYSFVNEYGKLIYLWYYAIIPVSILTAYWVWNIIINMKIAEIKKNNNIITDNNLNNEYKNINNRIYEITLKIICLNEYADELKELKNDDLVAKWNQIVDIRRESIDQLLKYNVSPDAYLEYLENYINKQQER